MSITERTIYLLQLMGSGALSVTDAAELKRLLEAERHTIKDKFRAWRREMLIKLLEDYILGRIDLMLRYVL